MVTLEDIENEIDSSKQVGLKAKLAAKMKASLMGQMITRLKKQEELLKEIPDISGPSIIKALICGHRALTAEELLAVQKRFGPEGIGMIRGLGCLNIAQKQWIFKQMGYDIAEAQ